MLGCQAVQGGSQTTPPPSGSVTISKASLDFGTVTVGQTATLSDSIVNSTSSSVSVPQPTMPTGGFSITSPAFPASVAAGQSVAIQMAFKPTAAGAHSGTVTVTAGGTNLVITVTGSAVAGGTLSGNPSTVGFGSVQVGKSSTIAETITNTGSASVTVSQANLTGSGFSITGLTLPTTLNANQSATVSVKFTPTSAGAVSGKLAIVSDASNSPYNIALSATAVSPGAVSANPASLTFGNVATGSSKTLSETLSNSGGAAVTISSITPSGTGFSITGVNPPVTLSPGQGATFSVTFAPQSGGAASGSLAVASNGSNPSMSVSLTGTGATPGQLAVTPTTMSFGSVVVGLNQSLTGSLTASGNSVTVTSIGTTNNEFSVSGITLPRTIAAGTSAAFTATFTPSASGAASGNLSFVSDASNSPAILAVSGTGTAPPQHSVTLNWSPSSSSNVVGYNVYRGGVSGGAYTKINSALDPNTTDTDTNVQGGQTYYYVVTAVDSNGLESGYSNQVQAVIPFP